MRNCLITYFAFSVIIILSFKQLTAQEITGSQDKSKFFERNKFAVSAGVSSVLCNKNCFNKKFRTNESSDSTFFDKNNDILIYGQLFYQLYSRFNVDYSPEEVPIDIRELCRMSFGIPDNIGRSYSDVTYPKVELINFGISYRHNNLIHSLGFSNLTYDLKIDDFMLCVTRNNVNRTNLCYEADYLFFTKDKSFLKPFVRLRLQNSFVDYFYSTYYHEDMIITGRSISADYDTHMMIHGLQPCIGFMSIKSIFNIEFGITLKTFSFAYGRESYNYYDYEISQLLNSSVKENEHFSVVYGDFGLFDVYFRLSLSLGRIIGKL